MAFKMKGFPKIGNPSSSYKKQGGPGITTGDSVEDLKKELADGKVPNFRTGKEKRQDERAERKAANKAYRQSLRADRKREKEARPYVQGTKTSSELLSKLENPKKTEEKHGVKKGLKGMAGLAAAGVGITKFFNRNKQPGNWWKIPKQ